MSHVFPSRQYRVRHLCHAYFTIVYLDFMLPQVGSEFAVGPLEQQRQIEALRVLDAVLATLMSEDAMNFAGLNFHLYHPETCPLGAFGLHSDDHYGLGAGHLMRSHVADDGCLHVVADRYIIADTLSTFFVACSVH